MRLMGASLPKGIFPSVKIVKGRSSKDFSLCFLASPPPVPAAILAWDVVFNRNATIAQLTARLT